MQQVKGVTFQVKKEHIFMMLIHHQDIRNPPYLTTIFTYRISIRKKNSKNPGSYFCAGKMLKTLIFLGR